MFCSIVPTLVSFKISEIINFFLCIIFVLDNVHQKGNLNFNVGGVSKVSHLSKLDDVTDGNYSIGIQTANVSWRVARRTFGVPSDFKVCSFLSYPSLTFSFSPYALLSPCLSFT